MATSPVVPHCPQCGDPVYRTHKCRASALRPRPRPEPHRDPPAAPRFGPCLHASPCLEVRREEPCPLIVPKPLDFDERVRVARAAAAGEPLTLDVWGRAYREDVGL